ncbi:MAG TPA: cyclomaltodextrinase N-terminal domain-containing protein, partial [Chitinophagaceae bacterium]|nr:cyclomaltodextrinase N-terminal domain-containing protein [Chitinophagaceae bacterium]
MKRFILLPFLLLQISLCAQDIYPAHWWTGMKNNKLQLMIHSDKDIAVDKLVVQSSSPEVKVLKVHRLQNRHYIFIDLEIAKNAKPQKVKFAFGGIIRSEWSSVDFELKARSRENGKSRIQGVTAKDLVYLI